MAKPIVELLTELQTAVEQADSDQTALQAAQRQATAELDAAKAAYDAANEKATGAVNQASAKFADSSAYVRSLQDEVNAVLGRFDSRVRQG